MHKKILEKDHNVTQTQKTLDKLSIIYVDDELHTEKHNEEYGKYTKGEYFDALQKAYDKIDLEEEFGLK